MHDGFKMSDIQVLTALVHQLVQAQPSDTQIVNVVLESVDISQTIATDVLTESKLNHLNDVHIQA